MALIRDPGPLDNTVSYIATLAFFCCVSCLTLMMKFGGFKATFNLYNGNSSKVEKELNDSDLAGVSITGAYRTNRDEFFGNNYTEAQRKITPSIVPVTSTEKSRPLRQVKSASELIRDKNLPPNLQQDQPGISRDPRGAEQQISNIKNQETHKKTEKTLDAQKKVDKQKLAEQNKKEKQRREEQKKLEKQRAEEEKKRNKLAAQEQAKREKLKKENEKKEAARAKKNKKTQRPLANPLAQATTAASNALAQIETQYATNTLESSISKSSGPPPYSEMIKLEQTKDSGNVTYSKPIDKGSWDMISKHRENINKHTVSGTTKQAKQTMMDLNYKMDEGNENSEA